MDLKLFNSVNRGSAWATLIGSGVGLLSGVMMSITIVGLIPGIIAIILSALLFVWSLKSIKRQQENEQLVTLISGILGFVTGLCWLVFIISELMIKSNKGDTK